MIGQFLIGLCSGVISGMGIGGGTILIPALVLLCGLEQKTAQAVNLIYFVPTALVALYFHKKNDAICTGVVKPLVLWGLLGAIGGALVAVNLEQELLRKFFGVFLLLMGIYEFFKKEAKHENSTV